MGCAIAFQSSNSPPPSRSTICKMSDLFVAKKVSISNSWFSLQWTFWRNSFNCSRILGWLCVLILSNIWAGNYLELIIARVLGSSAAVTSLPLFPPQRPPFPVQSYSSMKPLIVWLFQGLPHLSNSLILDKWSLPFLEQDPKVQENYC